MLFNIDNYARTHSRKHNKHSRFFKPTESNFGILFSILILDSKMVRKVDGLWYFASLSASYIIANTSEIYYINLRYIL
jgi:hypothetical protein